jgi:riboflavin synthase
MFTGLVEGTGRIVRAEPRDGITRLLLDAGPLADGVRAGDSISLNGCCLTAMEIDGPQLGFDLLQETEKRTNLRGLAPGARVNLERALPAVGRYGGHFVTGHIDATGLIRSWQQVGADYEMRIGIRPEEGAYVVPKGCIAVDGISLTVGEVLPDQFTVWIIPHTRAVTALGERRVGDLVNLEFDLLAKYTEKILATRSWGRSATPPPSA